MATLSELVDFKGGGTPSKAVEEYWGGDIPWASVKDFKSSEINETVDYITDKGLKNSASNLIPKGNLIIPTRMALGKVAINNVDVAINQDLRALIVKDESIVNKRYLFRFMESKARYLEGEGKGATVKGITLDVLKPLDVFLPPLNEQKRIAAILDKADSLRRKRQQAIQLADQFLRSVFLDLFGDPVTNSKGWEIGSFGDICTINPKSDKYKDDLIVSFVPMSRVSENSSTLDLEENRTYGEVKKGFTAFIEGDVLFAKITPCMENGKAGIARGLENEIGFGSTEFHVFRSFKTEYVEFIYSLVHLELFRKLSANNFSGAVGHKRVPKDFLENFPLYLSPSNLIKEYSNIFNRVKGLLERLEVTEVSNSVLFNSLSQKAFAGKL